MGPEAVEGLHRAPLKTSYFDLQHKPKCENLTYYLPPDFHLSRALDPRSISQQLFQTAFTKTQAPIPGSQSIKTTLGIKMLTAKIPEMVRRTPWPWSMLSQAIADFLGWPCR